MRVVAACAAAAAMALAATNGSFAGQTEQAITGPAGSPSTVVLVPTEHSRVPRDLGQLWLAPVPSAASSTARSTTSSQGRVALDQLATAINLVADGQFAKALPILSQPSIDRSPLGTYAEFYKGLAELRLGRTEAALATFQMLQSRELVGYLVEIAALREAECDEALGDEAAALAIYERLATMKTTAPDDMVLRIAKTAKAVGDAEKARAAFARVYYEFPSSDLATLAATELDNGQSIVAGSNRYKLELGRAERLFGGKKYAQAQAAFEALRGAAQGDDRELVNLRLAESDYFLRRPRNAQDGVKPYIDHASRQGEALFFYALAARELGDFDRYLTTVRRIVNDFPTQSWAEEALNNLGTYYILDDNDAQADEVFRELYEKYPRGRYAERAAWKIGWRAFKAQDYRDTIRIFERAAFDFPRSDYRPPWLYWSGRAHEALGETALAEARYTLVVLDYLNSYYGRLAVKRLGGSVPERRLVVAARDDAVGANEIVASALPPNAATVRALLGVKLYGQALDELRYAQKAWGDSAAIQATIAWIYREQGRSESGTEQFNHYRGAITLMRRAYPQFLAAGGEHLPKEMLKIIFPIGYWDLIRKHSAEQHLDPYVVAALMQQESTFVADIRSPAKAVGLMQLEPSLAKAYARKLKMRYSARLLTNPDANIRIGTAYLADTMRGFGDLHLVLASYNAGERAVRRWTAERPGVSPEEFIDDIPYPETQNYVKKILGMAEDYRRLYGPEPSPSTAGEDRPPVVRAASADPAEKDEPAAQPPKKKRSPPKPTRKRRRSA
jgi:soluble lytic murein transglycosylase